MRPRDIYGEIRRGFWLDRKEAFEQLLAQVDPEKRDEAYAKLAAAETRAEKIAIFESYGVNADEGWDKDARELTDEELEAFSGGVDWEEIWRSRDCNCEP